MKDTRLSESELDAAVCFAYGGGAYRRARKVQARTLLELFRPHAKSADKGSEDKH